MNIILSLCSAILLWSLYPLGVTLGLKSMSAFELILMAYVIASIGATALGLFYLWKKKLFTKAIEIQKTLEKRAYIIIIASGIVGVLCHGFFILALTLANKGGVSLLYESWPVLAIIATPFLMKKTWKEVSLKEFLVSIIAMIGVAIIIFSDENVGIKINEPKMLSDSMNFSAIGGYILAFAGAYMLALVVITKGAYSEYFSDLKDDFGATLISEMLSRIICVFVVLAIYIMMDIRIDQSHINWGISIFIGFVVFVLGGAFYTYALLLSTSPTIHVLNYFVPVLAVIWLWIAGETTVNGGLVIGGVIVTLCNIYLVYAGRRAKLAEAL
ncbi:MAG TPA: EamA family transporter [Alphaproteobacteria bacterium]|nr:EamA family transporter [Alphaproteobacteria bacterium]